MEMKDQFLKELYSLPIYTLPSILLVGLYFGFENLFTNEAIEYQLHDTFFIFNLWDIAYPFTLVLLVFIYTIRVISNIKINEAALWVAILFSALFLIWLTKLTFYISMIQGAVYLPTDDTGHRGSIWWVHLLRGGQFLLIIYMVWLGMKIKKVGFKTDL